MKNVFKILMLSVLLFSCQKEDIQHEEDKLDCKCGIITEVVFNTYTWENDYKVRNQCTNKISLVTLDSWIEQGNTVEEGSFVCGLFEW